MFKKDHIIEIKARAAVDSYNKLTERTPRKCCRCVYEDHLIAKCSRPPKYNEKRPK